MTAALWGARSASSNSETRASISDRPDLDCATRIWQRLSGGHHLACQIKFEGCAIQKRCRQISAFELHQAGSGQQPELAAIDIGPILRTDGLCAFLGLALCKQEQRALFADQRIAHSVPHAAFQRSQRIALARAK
jgi:hypothetical protein